MFQRVIIESKVFVKMLKTILYEKVIKRVLAIMNRYLLFFFFFKFELRRALSPNIGIVNHDFAKLSSRLP